MTDKLADYRRAAAQPKVNCLLPLFGRGFENLGRDGRPIEVRLPAWGSDELLVRYDACGLCTSDTKVIRQGEEHPRIRHSMRADPVILGHEVSLTVVGVGENLRRQYSVGDRFTLQPDIWVGGKNYAFGYEIKGGLAQYGVLDQRVLNGDHGNYLVPIPPDLGYAESALIEPWSCVVAAYQLKYRTGLKPGGIGWILGTASARRDRPYVISAGFDEACHPERLLLTDIPPDFARWLTERATAAGVEAIEVDDVMTPPVDQVDDIVLLGADPDVIEAVSPRLANFGVIVLLADAPLSRSVQVDIGRVHYNRWLYVGGTGVDIARAYGRVPVRSALKPGGRAWYIGAGGAMGRMHVQYALRVANGPATIVCTDVSDARLEDLRLTFSREAVEKGISFLCLNPTDREQYAMGMEPFRASGFDDIVALVALPAVISEAEAWLAPEGVMNIFAGAARGTMVPLNLSNVYLKDTRVIGHTSSTIADMQLMLHQIRRRELSPSQAVAAIGSLSAARDGLRAVQDMVFPGKIVIYPHIRDFPLTALPDLRSTLPSVYARLKSGREWTAEAEEEFLRLMLA